MAAAAAGTTQISSNDSPRKMKSGDEQPKDLYDLMDLVGSEEEEKNWKGIVIALVVIAVILSLITTAIILVTPAKEEYNPGEPFTFSHLTDNKLKLSEPIFSWVTDSSNKYVLFTPNDNSDGDIYTSSRISVVDPNNQSESVFVPAANIADRFRDLERVTISPDLHYALIQMQSESNSIVTKSVYEIFRKNPPKAFDVDSSNKKLQYAGWVGTKHDLVYIKDNDIYYKSAEDDTSIQVTNDGSNQVLNGIPDAIYKTYIFPKLRSLTWPSKDGKFVYAKINLQSEIGYIGKDQSTPQLTVSADDKAGSVTLYAFNGTSSIQLELPNSQGYLTSVLWMTNDKIMIVWLALDQQSEQYLICDAADGSCSVNYEYQSSALQLHWVGLYGTPIYNKKKDEYYLLLPDPSQPNKLYRHISSIKVDKSKRHDPVVSFLTTYSWSDKELLALVDNVLFYLSTGDNYTHQHLFSLNINTKAATCLSCDLDLRNNVTYVDVMFSSSLEYIYLSVLGPNLPSYHIIPTTDLLKRDTKRSVQLGKDHFNYLNDTLAPIHMPSIEYLTIPLENDMEASIKLMLPSVFNREKTYLYSTLIVLNDIPNGQIATQQYSLGLYDYLAKNHSYIIALVDIRGSSGQGEMLSQSIHGGLGSVEAADISKIVSFLSENFETYKVNESAIAVMGKGYGGFAGLHALSKEGINCSVIQSPITSLNKHGWLASRYMDGKSNKTKLNYVCTDSSTTCSMPHTSSILVIHGTDDDIVPIEDSMSLMRSLQLASYGFKQQLYPGVGYDIEHSDVAAHYYQTITQYLSECFQGHHTHDPLYG